MTNDNTIRDVNISAQSGYPIYFSHMKTSTDDTNQSFHLHDMLEIYVYVSGDVDFIIGDNYKSLKYGDILFTFPNELHRPVIKGSSEYERFFITVPMDTFESFDTGEGSPLDCFFNARHTDNRAIEISDEDKNTLLHILGKISRHISEGEGIGYLTYSYFLRALYILNKAKNTSLIRDTNLPRLLCDVLSFISENYATISTVSEIARHFHVSSSYLSSLFSGYMKVGLKQYLQYKKISGAKIMLSQGGNVTDVCFECGFNSCSHFISVFKAATGMTPNKYRAINGNEV